MTLTILTALSLILPIMIAALVFGLFGDRARIGFILGFTALAVVLSVIFTLIFPKKKQAFKL